jgi:hypothetical protein
VRPAPFLAALAACLALALLVIAALPRLGLARPSAELVWTQSLYVQKTRIADAIAGPRILVVGGSGTLFSFDSTVAGAAIGRPMVNFGTHAGLGMAYILDRAARLLHRGDIVVLAPEYEFLQQPDRVNEFAIQLAVFFDPAFIAAQPLAQRPHYWLGYGVLPSLTEGLRWALHGAPPQRTDIRLDALGNARGNSVAGSANRALSLAGPDLPVAPVTPAAVTLLRRFMAQARALDVTVYAIPPALVSTPGYRAASFRRFQDNLPALFASLGMIPAGSAGDGFLAPQDMYDSVYHANDSGRAVYTERMVRALCQRMTCR